MIFVDRSEMRAKTTMPKIEGSTTVPDLESRTGADFMISPLAMPISTDVLLKAHLEAGAILVQRKHGRDLVSSVGVRLNSSLSKMRTWIDQPAQCMLLFVGFLGCTKGGKAVVNKQSTSTGYWTVRASMDKWNDRGGCVVELPRVGLLEDWAKQRERHLIEYQTRPIKEVWPDKPIVQTMDKFLQTLQPVNDGRVLLATLPGIGAKTANLLYDEFKGSIVNALCWLTMPHHKKYPKTKVIPGIGHKTIENVREYFQLDDVMSLGVDVMEKELWQGKAKGKD